LACYVAEEFHTTEWDSLPGDIPNRLITDAHGKVTFGLVVCNVPDGSRAFVTTYFAWKGTHVRRGFNVIEHLLDPGRLPHLDIPAGQMLWILTLACLQFTGDYWIRHVQPDYTIEFTESIDAGVEQIFQMCERVDINSWSKHVQEQINLPIQLQGCSLRMAEDRRYVQFMGGMIQSVLPLIVRKDQEGNTIPGRLHMPTVVNMLGKDSIYHPPTSPWETLLSAARPTSNLKSGLQYTWLHLTQNFQDVATALKTLDKNLLLSQSVERARFNADGTHAPSVTNALTLEMETQWSCCLGRDTSNIKLWRI
jgi:hypothetical protein